MKKAKPSLHQTLSAFKDKYVVNSKSKKAEARHNDTVSGAGAFSEFINDDTMRILSEKDKLATTNQQFGFTHSAAFDC